MSAGLLVTMRRDGAVAEITLSRAEKLNALAHDMREQLHERIVEAARDEGHLEACATCRNELRRWRELLVLIREASAPSALELERVWAELDRSLPDGLARRREGSGRPWARLRLLRGGAAAALTTAAAAVVALLALQLGGRGFGAQWSSADGDGPVLWSWDFELPHWSEILDGLVPEGELPR